MVDKARLQDRKGKEAERGGGMLWQLKVPVVLVVAERWQATRRRRSLRRLQPPVGAVGAVHANVC